MSDLIKGVCGRTVWADGRGGRTAEFFARLGAWQMKQYEHTASDYEPVKPLARAFDEVEAARASRFDAGAGGGFAPPADESVAPGSSPRDEDSRAEGEGSDEAADSPKPAREWPPLRRAHALSFAGLLLFTAVVYFRPQEWIPGLTGFRSIAFWIATLTLAVFLPTQLGLEGTLTARPREVNLVLLLLAAGLLSVPLALEPAEAWGAFADFAKVVTMFVVMVNVVRTAARLRAMFWLAFFVSVVLSVRALWDYTSGRLNPGRDRIEGAIVGGIFENPNDLALHLVTMIPLALGLLFVSRGLLKKALYAGVACLMLMATVVTYSRGGLLGLGCASFVLTWKLKRRNRALVVVGFVLAALVFVLLAPSGVASRFGGEDGGSADMRQALLIRSIVVSIFHPVLGVGMDNFHILSLGEKVSHNAYTQVSAEMGAAALALYVLFMWASLRRMRRIEVETAGRKKEARVHYMAVALQASLVGYMVCSFFASVAYLWYVYYLVGYALCLHRLYEAEGLAVFSRATRSAAPETPAPDAAGADLNAAAFTRAAAGRGL
ncbi:MAG TPA: O-antigen ligase family protein [Pyrinomonadaceae bacterium]|nr:O-antigen ligase family protein [Pyrinomonadaceae bacterium]